MTSEASDVFVRVRGLGKRYVLYDRPLWNAVDLITGKRRRGREHWALSGVDFDLRAGDCLGIVGRNGAGKSTLLKLVCGISQPSTGTIEVGGRIAALLQLGAGFNPEFTGVENVRLASALYGMAGDEIERRMDAIAAFAGIGDFIERPVREYSSGMYARLAFSVCAHVDADILVVDEILGVGDVRFQQQSMRFLRRFRRKGIVLFVSHDEAAVAALCDGAIWIDKGRLVAAGPAKDVLHRYRREASRLMLPGAAFLATDGASPPPVSSAPEPVPPDAAPSEPPFDPDDPPPPTGDGRLLAVRLLRDGRELTGPLVGGDELRLEATFTLDRAVAAPRVVFALRNPLGQIVLGGNGGPPRSDVDGPVPPGVPAATAFTFLVPHFRTGAYPIEVFLLGDDGACLDHRETAVVLQVLADRDREGVANMRMHQTLLTITREHADHDG